MCVPGHEYYHNVVEDCPYTCSEGGCDIEPAGNPYCQDEE